MARAPVPETAIHKNSKPLAAEYKVRLAGQPLMAAPACNVMCPHDGDKLQFRVLVARGADGRHDLGSFLFGENINHKSLSNIT